MDFKEIQSQFVDSLRDPENTKAPQGIERRRVKIYQDLLFNNLVNFLQTALPVTRSLYDEDDWHKLVRTFFINHKSTSPYFIDISKAFVEFLNHQYVLQDADPACLLYLAHYEWIELDVSVDNGVMVGDYYTKGHPELIALVPSARLVQYPLQVHQISADYRPEIAPDALYYYLVFRDQTHNVIFKQISVVVTALLQPLINGDFVSPLQLAEQLRAQLPYSQSEQLNSEVTQVVDELLQSGALMVNYQLEKQVR